MFFLTGLELFWLTAHAACSPNAAKLSHLATQGSILYGGGRGGEGGWWLWGGGGGAEDFAIKQHRELLFLLYELQTFRSQP